jgi:pyruvate dehydrogenase E2 component (dihydrolipoamide acetyltransferase)
MRSQSTKSSPAAADGSAVPIEMPRLSSDEGTATLSAWLVAVGDQVEKGGLIAELETDKATVELEAPVGGRVESLVVAAGTEGVKPGTLLGRIVPAAAVVETATQSAAAPVAVPRVAPIESVPPVAPESGMPPPAAPPIAEGVGRVAATPLARRIAEAQGVDLERITGTGVGGRIVQADVERSASEPAARVEPVAVASPRVAVGAAVALATAARSPAHLAIRCAMGEIVAARARLNADLAARGQGARITLNDFIVRAAGLALRAVPAANRRRVGEAVEAASGVDVALVVASASGPRTTVLRDADRKGLAVLSEEIRSRVEQARAGEAVAPEDSSASLLVTSFARYGIESAYPMLPRDQVCVLGVGTVLEQPVVRGGALAVGWTLSLTLGFDPEALGGAVAAELLGVLRGQLEDPLGMML